jgi:alcohol dehydrogenase (cytochrome c)
MMRPLALAVLLGAIPALAQSPVDGAKQFATRCAGCHGTDAHGGEHGPDIVTGDHAMSGGELRRAIRDGVPGGGMPSFKLSDAEMAAIVLHVETLQANVRPKDGAKAPARPIPFSEIVRPKPGEWPTYHGKLSGNRHSSLNEITAANVSRLAMRWMFPVEKARRLQGTPVVVDGVMYVTTVNEAYAIDAVSAKQIWHYARPVTPSLVGDAAGGINRGVAVLNDKLFMVTDNAHLLALDRATGALVWDVEMNDSSKHYGATSAPLVVKDLVISGTSGGDEGARGFIDAYRASNGEHVWRFWTIPEKPGDPQSETWVGRALEHGCGTAWFTGAYDPGADLLYWPTGNPCPDYNGDERKGDNLYSDSVLALEPSTGKLRWHYQFTPHDLHDWDSAEPLLLADIELNRRQRKVLMQGNRNGFFYVLDRITGEFIGAEPFVHKLTWASGIGKDGRPMLLPNSDPTPEGTKVCPSVDGASNWMSTAYNPNTKLFYLMTLEACNIFTKSDAWWERGKSFYGGGTKRVPGEVRQKVLRAIDPTTRKIVWELPQTGRGTTWGGLLSTNGGLIFYCDDSGTFAAVDAKTGKPLWQFQANQNWHASPMTYAVNGKQYVAIAAGSNVLAFALQ